MNMVRLSWTKWRERERGRGKGGGKAREEPQSKSDDLGQETGVAKMAELYSY